MRRFTWVVFVCGLSAVIAQTLVIREGLALFGGYELVSGILICFWLVWGSIGSILFSRLHLKSKPQNVYAVLLIVLSIFIVTTITFFRYALTLFKLPFGEVIGIDKMIVISFVSLAPSCMVFGALYPAASRIVDPEKVYLVEGLGAFIGGVLLSFVLIDLLPPYGIVLVVFVLLFICALLLLGKTKLLILPILMLLILIKTPDIEMFFRKAQLGQQDLLGLRESRYGVIAVTKTLDQTNFYVNGIYSFSYPDLYTSEEAVHYPLLLHGHPQRVLLIGGGVTSCIEQILKHPSVTDITYVELDPLLVSTGEEYIGSTSLQDNAVHVVIGDARHFVKTTQEKYDVVIVNLPDPVNAQLNRFYTTEFFNEVRQILSTSGMFSVRISAPSDIIGPLDGQYLYSVYTSLATSFDNIILLPAAKLTFIASDVLIPIDSVPVILQRQIIERNMELIYVNEYFFRYNFTPEKMNYIRERIKESHGYVNTDTHPVCYYYTLMLWGGLSTGILKNVFFTLFKINPLFYLLPLLFILLFYRRRVMVHVSVMAIGATEISTEVILIVMFQVYYGYVYSWIGIIIACYMLGLAAGTFYYLRVMPLRGEYVRTLSNVALFMALYCTAVFGISFTNLPGIRAIIPLLVFFGGFLGGVHFPLSVKILRRRNAGVVYGIDLLGSSIGAFATSIVFIPILGIPYTVFLFVILNVLVAFGLRTVR
jgi:spermidine synthase